MASKTSKAKSVRLPNEFIKAAVAERLERYQVPDLTACEGQQELF